MASTLHILHVYTPRYHVHSVPRIPTVHVKPRILHAYRLSHKLVPGGEEWHVVSAEEQEEEASRGATEAPEAEVRHELEQKRGRALENRLRKVYCTVST
eukprot:CAMPEP_0119483930 /NCGR_PEP_ID=MMETSP1344-20130328/11116_1 /TAXON_ID=236787 /ORGANISM="Florenciella parvula, Strain CCMP2471" /LENGTH=98 /DNA_ID=CAMNT_0007518461 /DNA_START=254 /DNA_END=547 /DNA_ORIENTATION=+